MQRIFLLKGEHACAYPKIYPTERLIYFDYDVVLTAFIRIQAKNIPEFGIESF